MFVKTGENHWINLSQCPRIQIKKNGLSNWEIVFSNLSNDFDTEKSDSLGGFRSESEAHESLDEIWEAYREGKPYFEPDPRKKMNVRLGDKWYADNEPIQIFLDVIQRLRLEKIEAQGLTFKDKYVPKHEVLIVTKDRVKGLEQEEVGGYYVLRLKNISSMKETLESIASELKVDIEVTTYQE